MSLRGELSYTLKDIEDDTVPSRCPRLSLAYWPSKPKTSSEGGDGRKFNYIGGTGFSKLKNLRRERGSEETVSAIRKLAQQQEKSHWFLVTRPLKMSRYLRAIQQQWEAASRSRSNNMGKHQGDNRGKVVLLETPHRNLVSCEASQDGLSRDAIDISGIDDLLIALEHSDPIPAELIKATEFQALKQSKVEADNT